VITDQQAFEAIDAVRLSNPAITACTSGLCQAAAIALFEQLSAHFGPTAVTAGLTVLEVEPLGHYGKLVLNTDTAIDAGETVWNDHLAVRLPGGHIADARLNIVADDKLEWLNYFIADPYPSLQAALLAVRFVPRRFT
jgi:hypothetical protein